MRRAAASSAALRLAALFALAARAPVATAQPAGDDRVVDVVIAAAPSAAAVLEVALREPLQREGVRMRWVRVEWFELSEVVVPDPAAPPAVARAWFDLVGISRRPGEPPGPVAVVYLADGPWEHVLVRTVPFDAGLDEVAREEFSQILASGVEGILAGAAPGRPREEVREELGVAAAPAIAPPVEPRIEAPAEPPPPEPRLADLLTVEVGASYALDGYSSVTAPGSAFGLGLGLAERSGRVRFGGWLSGSYALPVEAERGGVGVRLDVGSLRLLATAELPLARWAGLQLGVGAGLDVARVEPQRTSDVSVDLQPVSDDTTGVFQAQLAARFALGLGCSLWLGIGVDVNLGQRRYVVDRGAVREAVLEPWPARPFGLLRLTYDVLDGAATGR